MALEINHLRDSEDDMPKWTADRRLFLDATKTKVVEDGPDGDPPVEAAFLLCPKGREVSANVVKQYKLRNKPKRGKARKPADDKATKPAADK